MDKPKKQRTLSQNSSMHLWCQELAQEANNKGIRLKALVETLNVDVTPEAVKMMIQEIGKVKYGKNKTSTFDTKEMTECCKEVDLIFLEKGIKIDFPSFETKSFNEHYDNI